MEQTEKQGDPLGGHCRGSAERTMVCTRPVKAEVGPPGRIQNAFQELTGC